jgi:hypothetical protein
VIALVQTQIPPRHLHVAPHGTTPAACRLILLSKLRALGARTLR